MNKVPLFIIFLVIIALLASTDFVINTKGVPASEPTLAEAPAPTVDKPVTTAPNYVERALLNPALADFQLVSRDPSSQVFEKIDLSGISNLSIFRNQLSVKLQGAASEPIFIYEMQGPAAQGSLTYLNVKLQFISQTSSPNETLNEVSNYGDNAFFLNDQNYPSTGFMVAQVRDNLFAFQYIKDKPETFETIKSLINALMELNAA